MLIVFGWFYRWEVGGCTAVALWDADSRIFFNKARSILGQFPSLFISLVDKYTCLGSSVSSTESDINIRLAKAWTAIDWLSII